MTGFFIRIYRFFAVHKVAMWLSMLLSALIFAIIGSRMYFEENIAKLFPSTENVRATTLAFGNLKVKDKVFMEVIPREGYSLSPEDMAAVAGEYADSLLAHDADSLISGCLWRMDDDITMNALDFLLCQAATFVTPELYPVLDDWVAAGCPQVAPAELEEMLGDFMSDYALIDGQLFTPDSTAAIIYLSPSFNSLDTEYCVYLVEYIENQSRLFYELHPEIEVLTHGAAIEGANNSRRIKKDLMLTITLSLLVICCVICFCFKNKSTLPLLLSPVAYGVLFAMAVSYLIKGEVSLLAMGLGAIVLGVALSYCLHVLTHYKYVSDPEQVIREQARPVCLGCLTTIGAFAGLLLTTSELLSDFGMFASLALIGNTFFALVYLPHFFRPEHNARSKTAFNLADRINSYQLDRKYVLVAILSVIIVISICKSGSVKFDSDLHNIGYKAPDFIRSETIYRDRVDHGKQAMFYAGTGETLDEAVYSARRIESCLDSLKSSGEVYSRSRMQELLIPLDEQQNNIDRWKEYWKVHTADLPDDVPGMMRAVIEADYEPAELPESGALPDELLSNFVEQSADGDWLIFVSARLNTDNSDIVSDAVASIPGAIVVDPFYYTDNMVEIIHNDFNLVLWISSMFVLLVLLLSFRNIPVALLAFMPMFLSWYAVQGIMAIFGLKFNLISIVVSSFIFGIGVDYSIFVMDGLLDKARGGSGRLLVCHKTAILFSAFVLITVVVSLLFAKHASIRSIGVSTLIGMASTLLITHTLQPLLFRLLMKCGPIARQIVKTKKNSI